MADIKSPRLIYLKGLLFFVSGTLASALLLYDHPTLRTALLLLIAIWCFCRFYYFAFYVIQHYVDGDFRFAGLSSFVAHAVRQRFGWKDENRGD
ncbi:MAG: hypothetical protein R3C19_02380 [Planctomycetaceae bacterium]